MAGDCAHPPALWICSPTRRHPRRPRTSRTSALVTEFDPFFNNVSVVVLNYNQAATTVECLDALAGPKSDLVREIIVVDNGSAPEELFNPPAVSPARGTSS